MTKSNKRLKFEKCCNPHSPRHFRYTQHVAKAFELFFKEFYGDVNQYKIEETCYEKKLPYNEATHCKLRES